MLASLLCPVTTLICRVSTLFEDRIVTVVALREWLVYYGKIPALSVIFRRISHPVFLGVMPQALPIKPDLVFFQGDILRTLE